MNSVLYSKYSLIFSPKLAFKIGLNESIILQQVHYWVKINETKNQNKRDGYYWVYYSVKNWQKENFMFWSCPTVYRAISNLENMHLLVSGNYNKMGYDRTKWYRIDYRMLEALQQCPFYQNDKINLLNWLKAKYQNYETNTRNYSETNSENNIIGNFPKGKIPYINFKEFTSELDIKEYRIEIVLVNYYLNKYKIRKGKSHPKCTRKEWLNVIISMFDFDDKYLDNSTICDMKGKEKECFMKEIIDLHFEKTFQTYKHDIRSFHKFAQNELYEKNKENFR